ncbi:MAG: nuclear transport factor 2 family protein [Acidobacteria bacterium]|nr:nuclear transport factor 2 family protein [Acidobacteriota bacterium]
MRFVIILALTSQVIGSEWTPSTPLATARGDAQVRTTAPAALRAEVEALNAAMVSAFKTNPATVADFYSDDARIMGGGQAYQGRQEIAAYWAQATMFVDWTLEIIEVGGSSDAPWQLGRSVLTGKSGRTMETHFVGILERQPDGRLKFKLDMFTQASAKVRAPGAAVEEPESVPR